MGNGCGDGEDHTDHHLPQGTDWAVDRASAISRQAVQVKCKHHECPGPTWVRPVYIHLHGTGSIRQEVQDAMAVLLQELFLSESDIIYESVIGSQVLNLYEANMSRLNQT